MRLGVVHKVLLGVVVVAAVGLFGCTDEGSTFVRNPGQNFSIAGRWTGQMSGATGSFPRVLTMNFVSSGGGVTGTAELEAFQESNSPLGLGGATTNPFFIDGLADSFPVTVSGNQATFTTAFNDNQSTNVNAVDVNQQQRASAAPRGRVVIVIPGFTTAPITFNLQIGANALTGTYQVNGTTPSNGTVSLTRSTPPPDISGHWTGSSTSSQGQLATTMDLNVTRDPSNPNLFTNTTGLTTSINSAFVTNTWTGPRAVDGIMTDDGTMQFNMNFTTFHSSGTTDRIFPHRFFRASFNGGNTLTGVYADEFTQDPIGGTQIFDTGTFTLTRVGGK